MSRTTRGRVFSALTKRPFQYGRYHVGNYRGWRKIMNSKTHVVPGALSVRDMAEGCYRVEVF